MLTSADAIARFCGLPPGVVGPDGTVYVGTYGDGRLYRLRPGAPVAPGRSVSVSAEPALDGQP